MSNACQCGWGMMTMMIDGNVVSAFSEWTVEFQRSKTEMAANEDGTLRTTNEPMVPKATGSVYADCDFDFKRSKVCGDAVLAMQNGQMFVFPNALIAFNGGLNSRTGEIGDAVISSQDFEPFKYHGNQIAA